MLPLILPAALALQPAPLIVPPERPRVIMPDPLSLAPALGMIPFPSAMLAGASGPPPAILSLLGALVGASDNTTNTVAPPAHQAGDTLLGISWIRWGGSTLTRSGTGWGNATGLAGMQAFGIAGELLFSMIECTGSAHANLVVNPTGAGAGATIISTIVRIRGRRFGSNFSLGTVSSNGSNNNSIALTQNSPSIGVGDAILALGGKLNDGGANSWNAISGQAAGPLWAALVSDFNTAVGNDVSGLFLGAINNTGSAYLAGTGGSIVGRTLSVAAASSGVYLKISAG